MLVPHPHKLITRANNSHGWSAVKTAIYYKNSIYLYTYKIATHLHSCHFQWLKCIAVLHKNSDCCILGNLNNAISHWWSVLGTLGPTIDRRCIYSFAWFVHCYNNRHQDHRLILSGCKQLCDTNCGCYPLKHERCMVSWYYTTEGEVPSNTTVI
jgi:hypothetical protein